MVWGSSSQKVESKHFLTHQNLNRLKKRFSKTIGKDV
jgi:hypothetical protein